MYICVCVYVCMYLYVRNASHLGLFQCISVFILATPAFRYISVYIGCIPVYFSIYIHSPHALRCISVYSGVYQYLYGPYPTRWKIKSAVFVSSKCHA